MAWALNVDGLTTMQRVVLLGIANHHGDGGSWPSVDTLARYACAHGRTVQRTIGELEAVGLVVRQLNAGGTHSTRGDRRPNRYLLPSVDNHNYGVTPAPPREGNGVASGTSRGDTRATRTILEPSVLTSADEFTRDADEPVEENPLPLEDVRRLIREGMAAERVEQERLERESHAERRGR